MFGKQNQFATVAGFGVRVKDEREKDRNHLIETTFEVPLTHDLADEVLPAMARDLFQEVGGEWTPKPEMQDASFNIPVPGQILTVKPHPDLDALFKVTGVALRKIRAKKAEGNTWLLLFTATWTLGTDTEATAIIRSLKSGVYLTFEAQQPNMLDPGQAPEDGTTAQVDGGGNVTSITDGKKKRAGGRKKRDPEGEAKAQAEAGAAAAAADGGADESGGQTVN